jgi:hypothetical protein
MSEKMSKTQGKQIIINNRGKNRMISVHNPDNPQPKRKKLI